MGFLLANWKFILIAILAAACVLLFKLWQGEVRDFAEFKGGIVVLGQEMERQARETEKKQEQALKEAKDEWNKMLPGIRTNAVDNYMRRFPHGLCGNPSPGQVPGASSNPEGSLRAEQERVVVAGPASDFIGNCAEDAGKLKVLRGWAASNNIKGK